MAKIPKILKIFKSFDFRGNKIINAKVDTPTDSKHIANKEYADSGKIYDTAKAELYQNPFRFRRITNVFGKTFKEVFDDLLFPRIYPNFLNPTLNFLFCKYAFPNNEIIEVTSVENKYLVYYDQPTKLEFDYSLILNDRSKISLAYLRITDPSVNQSYFYETPLTIGKIICNFIPKPNMVFEFFADFGPSVIKNDSYNEPYREAGFESNYPIIENITSELNKRVIFLDSPLFSEIRETENTQYDISNIPTTFNIGKEVFIPKQNEGLFDLIIPKQNIDILEKINNFFHIELSKTKNIEKSIISNVLSTKYGALYNSYCIRDVRNIAPVGWHVPSQTEYQTLFIYLGGVLLAGKKLKETGLTNWNTPNTGTNTSLFNSRGSGYRDNTGFINLNLYNILGTSDILTEEVCIEIQNNEDKIDFVSMALYIGISLRLIKDDSNLSSMIGNDGKIYDTIKIGEQVWTSNDISETKFRNGDIIPIITDNTIWSITGLSAMCFFNNLESNGFTTQQITTIENNLIYDKLSNTFMFDKLVNKENIKTTIKYGAQYNWYTGIDIRNICSDGWHVPNYNEGTVLSLFLGGNNISGGKLKEIGFDYWLSPNIGATNEVGFNGRPDISGYSSRFLSISEYQPTICFCSIALNYNSAINYYGALYAKTSTFYGRLIKDSTILTHGQTGIYIGNDGKIYRTICIGTQEWLADNLCETKYRNGDVIPLITDDTEWGNLVTGAMRWDNNLESNGFLQEIDYNIPIIEYNNKIYNKYQLNFGIFSSDIKALINFKKL
jgi:uncharacterized protein (TIGR02145 family)